MLDNKIIVDIYIYIYRPVVILFIAEKQQTKRLNAARKTHTKFEYNNGEAIKRCLSNATCANYIGLNGQIVFGVAVAR